MFFLSRKIKIFFVCSSYRLNLFFASYMKNNNYLSSFHQNVYATQPQATVLPAQPIIISNNHSRMSAQPIKSNNKDVLISLPPQSAIIDESYASAATTSSIELSQSHHAQQSNHIVLMVYNLERLNCDRLFNLFCLYGNVDRVSYEFSLNSFLLLIRTIIFF